MNKVNVDVAVKIEYESKHVDLCKEEGIKKSDGEDDSKVVKQSPSKQSVESASTS